MWGPDMKLRMMADLITVLTHLQLKIYAMINPLLAVPAPSSIYHDLALALKRLIINSEKSPSKKTLNDAITILES